MSVWRCPLGGGDTRHTWRTCLLCVVGGHMTHKKVRQSPKAYGSNIWIRGYSCWLRATSGVYLYLQACSVTWVAWSSKTAGGTPEMWNLICYSCWYAIQVTESSEPDRILQHLLSFVNSNPLLNTMCWNSAKTSCVPNSSTIPGLLREHKVQGVWMQYLWCRNLPCECVALLGHDIYWLYTWDERCYNQSVSQSSK